MCGRCDGHAPATSRPLAPAPRARYSRPINCFDDVSTIRQQIDQQQMPGKDTICPMPMMARAVGFMRSRERLSRLGRSKYDPGSWPLQRCRCAAAPGLPRGSSAAGPRVTGRPQPGASKAIARTSVSGVAAIMNVPTSCRPERPVCAVQADQENGQRRDDRKTSATAPSCQKE